MYIAELDISRSHIGPHFFAHQFREFCRRGAQERDIFREIAVTPCIQFVGDNFSRNLLTAIAFVPVRWRQFFAKSTRAYLSMRAGTHAVRWAATLGGYIALSLISRYHCLDPTNRDISGLHCISSHKLSFNDTQLTDWGWLTRICISNLTIIGSDNGLSPDGRQGINWINAGILLIGP